MAEISKQALKTENQSSFPNNNSGLITPTILRDFNDDMIDSLVDEITFNAFSSSVTQSIQALQSFSSSLDTNFASQTEFNSFTQSADGRLDSLELATSSYANSASVAAVDAAQQLQINSLIAATASFVTEAESGSFLVTASFDNGTRNLTFTKGNSSTFAVNIPDVSGSASLPSGVVSGSSQIDYPLISNIPAGIVSGSSQLTASYDTRYTLSGSVQPLPSGVVSGSSQIILQSTTGNLSGSRIDGDVATAVSASHAVTSDTAIVANRAQDLYVNAKNTTSAIITKGSVVRITGASGDNPEIGLADWTNDLNSANTLGIVSADVAVNDFTDVIVQGKMIGLNTAAFTPGQLVFLGASGSIVASVPPQYHEVRLGQVLRQQTNNGSLYLSVDNGYELTELHDVNIVTASLANNNLLAYDSASQQWTNKTITEVGGATTGSNTFTGNQTINGFLTASLQQGYVWVGNASGQTTTVPTSSFSGGGSAFPYTGAAQITGSLSIKGTSVGVPVIFNIDTNAGGLGDLTFSGNDANFTVAQGDLKVNTDTANRGIQIQGPDPTIGFRDTTSPLNPYIAIQNKDKSFQIFDQGGTIATFNTASIQLLSPTFISASLTASLQEGYMWVGGIGNISTIASTGSFATTGSNTFNGNQTVNGFVSASNGFQSGPNTTALLIGENSNMRFYSGSNGSEYYNIQLIPGVGDIAFSRSGVANTKVFVLAGVAGNATNFQNNPVQFQSNVGSVQFDAPVVINSGINSSVQITGSLKISNGIVGVQKVNDVEGTGVGEVYLLGRSGSLVLANSTTTPTYAGLYHISSSAPNANTNLIFKNSSTAQSTIVSGSGNIFANPAAATAGFVRYVGQNSNIYTHGNSVPQISGSMGWSPSMNGNIFSHTQTNALTFRGPSTITGAGLINHNIFMGGQMNIGTDATNNAEKLALGITVASNAIFSGNINVIASKTTLGATPSIAGNLLFGAGVTLNHHSSSAINYSSNIQNGGIVVNNEYEPAAGSVAASKALRVSLNTIYGHNHVLDVKGTNVSTTQTKHFYANILAGMYLSASVGNGDSANMLATGMIGNSLIFSGSSTAAASTGTYSPNDTQGSLMVGRFNALDGKRASTAETVFAVGTGTAANRKTGLLIDSGSNTYVEGSLNVSGSTAMTGSATISQTLTLGSVDPLPAGTTGMLAVSQSLLWFYDATQWRQVSLI